MKKKLKGIPVWFIALILITGSVIGAGIWVNDPPVDYDYTIYMSDEERYPDSWEGLELGEEAVMETADFSHSGSGVMYHQYVRIDNRGNDEPVTVVAEVEEPEDFEDQMGFIFLEGIVEPGDEEAKNETVDSWGSITFEMNVSADQQRNFTAIYTLSHDAPPYVEDYDLRVTWSFYESTDLYDVEITSPAEGDEFVEGDDVKTDYNVTNIGDEAGEQNITFAVYDDNQTEVYTATEKNVSLQPNESYESNFTWPSQEGDTGEYTLEVASEDYKDVVNITMLEKAEFQVDIVDHDEKVEQGDNATVYYTVTNTGGVNDTQDVNFTVYDEGDVIYENNCTDLTLGPGETHADTFKWETNETHYGEYALNVSSEDDSDEANVIVWTDAYFQVEILDYDQEVWEGENITVEYNITNIGDVKDTQDILFRVYDDNGDRVHIDIYEDLTLGPGENYSDTFTWQTEKGDAGEYELKVSSYDEDENVTSSVKIALRPPEWITVEKHEQEGNLTVEWEDTKAPEFVVYYSQDQYANFSDWQELATVEDNNYTHEDALGGENYYIVRSSNGTAESKNSTMAFSVEKYFGDERPRHYISVPMGFANQTGELRASDLVKSIEGDLQTSKNISDVVKWNHTQRGYSERYYYDGLAGEWSGDDFIIEPGDGIGLSVKNSFTWHINGTDTEHEILYGDERPRHYTSIPYTLKDYTGTGELRASDLVKSIEGDLQTSKNISDVVKWNHTQRGYSERYYYDGLAGEWSGDDFVIEPGDGIGLSVKDEFTWEVDLITPEVKDENESGSTTRITGEGTNPEIERKMRLKSQSGVGAGYRKDTADAYADVDLETEKVGFAEAESRPGVYRLAMTEHQPPFKKALNSLDSFRYAEVEVEDKIELKGPDEVRSRSRLSAAEKHRPDIPVEDGLAGIDVDTKGADARAHPDVWIMNSISNYRGGFND